MTETEPIVPFRFRDSGPEPDRWSTRETATPRVSFDRRELKTILDIYGRKVAQGEWRDYALDFGRDMAVFSVFRRASEAPLYRIVKDPKLARREGAYSVIAQGGLILRRGQDLAHVVRVLLRRPRLAAL